MFTHNVGGIDRVARLAIAIVLLPVGLVALGGLGGAVVGLAVALPGFIGLVTAVTGFCPTYVLFGFSTARDRSPALGGAH
jgi:hypothetical protein